MQLPYTPDDPHLAVMMDYLRQYVVESNQSNMKLVAGQVAISCTASTLATQSVTFRDQTGKNAKPFLKGTVPIIIPFVNPTTTSSTVTPSISSVTNAGFTAQVYSSATQSVTFYYFALGQTQ